MNKKAAFLQVLRDRDRKPAATILKDMISYCIAHRENPTRFINLFLYRTNAGDPRSYLAKSETRKIHRYQRNAAVGHFFTNKVLFHHHFSSAGVRLPKLLGYNVGNRMILAEDSRSIKTVAEFRSVLEEFFASSPQIFMKAAQGSGGLNAARLCATELENSKLAAIHKRILSTSYIFQERIRQHPDLDAVYAGSINTVRVMTCMRGSDVRVLSAIVRFGTGNSHTDNISSGGLFTGIDLDTGKLIPPGKTYFKYGGGLFSSHPDTGMSFSDITIPCFPDVIETVIASCRHLPNKLVGWDIAVSPEGPVVIEANNWPSLDVIEIAYGGFRSHPVFGPFVKEIVAAS